MSWRYICRNCQTTTNQDGEKVEVDKERGPLNSKGTAEALAKIHEIKTGHKPEVIPA